MPVESTSLERYRRTERERPQEPSFAPRELPVLELLASFTDVKQGVQASEAGPLVFIAFSHEASGGTGANIALAEDRIRNEFRRHVAQWEDECKFLSSSTDRTKHEAYQAIISMGRQVLPLLLREMIERPNQWSAALVAICGENPVPPDARGDLSKVTAAWQKWALERGLVEQPVAKR
jgi:hypothetical protein